MTDIICIDFHGVLTDGKFHLSADGKTAFESCHVRDTLAIRELVARGYVVYVVTASGSPIIDAYCQKVGCAKLTLRDKAQLPFDNYIAIGDSAFDIPMLERAQRAYCPADVQNHHILEIPGLTRLKTEAGKGCIEEVLGLLEYRLHAKPLLTIEDFKSLLPEGDTGEH